MADWAIFAFIIVVIALDDILRELKSSLRAAFDLVRDRIRSIG